MPSLRRKWQTWRHARRFAVRGRRNRFPFPDLYLDGHVELGDMCRFRNNVVLRTFGTGKIIMGSRSGFSWNCVAEARERIVVGARTGIAENVVVRDFVIDLWNHPGDWRAAPCIVKPIHIGSDVFVGSYSYIGPGVTIGDSAVIAQHSLVLDDVGPGEIWDGRPARRIGHRTENVPERVRLQVAELLATRGVQLDRNEGQYRM